MNVKIQLDFPHDYQVDVLRERGAEMPIRIPDAGEPVPSLLVKITPPDAPAWVGSFARGFETDEELGNCVIW